MSLEKLYQEATDAKDPQTSLTKYLELLAAMELEFGNFDLRLCGVLTQLSGLQYDVGEYKKAIETAGRCLAIQNFQGDENRIIRSQLHNNIALSYWMLKDSKQAYDHFELMLQVLLQEDNSKLLGYALHDYKNFCYMHKNYDKLTEIAQILKVPHVVYTYLKDAKPVIFENKIIFCCTDLQYADVKVEFDLGKVEYFHLIPLSIEHGVSLVFDRNDQGRLPLEEFTRSFANSEG